MKPMVAPATKARKGMSVKAVLSRRERTLGGWARSFITKRGIRRVAKAMKPRTRTDQAKPMRGRRR